MVKSYSLIFTLYLNNEKIYQDNFSKILLEESDKHTRIIPVTFITWDNLKKEATELHPLLPFEVIKTKRGQKISFGWHYCEHKPIEQWKTPILNMSYEIEAKETSISMKELLNYEGSADMAIKYMVERGLSIKK